MIVCCSVIKHFYDITSLVQRNLKNAEYFMQLTTYIQTVHFAQIGQRFFKVAELSLANHFNIFTVQHVENTRNEPTCVFTISSPFCKKNISQCISGTL